MSESPFPTSSPLSPRVSLAVQVLAWIAALAVCVGGMLEWVAEWPAELATLQLFVLLLAPVAYMLPSRRPRSLSSPQADAPRNAGPLDAVLCLAAGGLSLYLSSRIGLRNEHLPPAYHDEFSYLFQAKTLLSGHLSLPSHPLHPELFDQMHVLNEGRMASRYYPGTGLWLAPFVAFGHPYLGPWIAGAIATMLIYWVGREISGRTTAIVASMAMAVSPGVNLFGNTLLAHHSTLMALSVFLLGVCRWRRTRSLSDALIAGCGLSFAMLCRPMTAAAIGFPFGVDVIAWIVRTALAARTNTTDRTPDRRPVTSLVGFGLPLLIGWGTMLLYNHSVTGDWMKSPYQLYTEIYTPRHVYGFNNVVRGEQHLGPKVIDAYDRWAENLTMGLALRNMLIRWISSWLWTFDIMPLLVSAIIVAQALPRLDRRWTLIVLAILSLHAAHIPYWYVGIMGWHYVFESAPLLCLVLGGATHLLFADWKQRNKFGLSIWWTVVLAISIAGIDPGFCPSRLQRGIGALQYPRQKHAQLRQWLEEHVDQRPALVLVEQQDTEASHLDLVYNEPGLQADLLVGRFRPGQTDVAQVRRDFPGRILYVACPERHTIRRIP